MSARQGQHSTWANRYSSYSNNSSAVGGARSGAQQSTQLSTTTLLNALHAIYTSGSIVSTRRKAPVLAVNTWLTALNPDAQGRTGGTVDAQIADRALGAC